MGNLKAKPGVKCGVCGRQASITCSCGCGAAACRACIKAGKVG